MIKQELKELARKTFPYLPKESWTYEYKEFEDGTNTSSYSCMLGLLVIEIREKNNSYFLDITKSPIGIEVIYSEKLK